MPSHLHYTIRHLRANYQDKVCPHYVATDITVHRDEIHIICHRSSTLVLLEKFTARFQGLTRLLDLHPFATFISEEMTQMQPPTTSAEESHKGLDYGSNPTLCQVRICPLHTCHFPTSSLCRLVLWWWCCLVSDSSYDSSSVSLPTSIHATTVTGKICNVHVWPRENAGNNLIVKTQISDTLWINWKNKELSWSERGTVNPEAVGSIPANTQKTENSYINGSELHRPSSKSTKLLLQVIKAIINQMARTHVWLVFWQDISKGQHA